MDLSETLTPTGYLYHSILRTQDTHRSSEAARWSMIFVRLNDTCPTRNGITQYRLKGAGKVRSRLCYTITETSLAELLLHCVELSFFEPSLSPSVIRWLTFFLSNAPTLACHRSKPRTCRTPNTLLSVKANLRTSNVPTYFFSADTPSIKRCQFSKSSNNHLSNLLTSKVVNGADFK